MKTGVNFLRHIHQLQKLAFVYATIIATANGLENNNSFSRPLYRNIFYHARYSCFTVYKHETLQQILTPLNQAIKGS